MSRELDYFPPAETTYKWWPKALNYCPWTTTIWELWPARITARVDCIDGKFKWVVVVYGFNHEHKELEGSKDSGLAACLKAEAVAEAEKSSLWKPWMEEAVKAGWRP